MNQPANHLPVTPPERQMLRAWLPGLGVGMAVLVGSVLLLRLLPQAALVALPLVAVVALWLGRSALFGPLFAIEVVRLSRGRRPMILRGLYAGALLIGLSVVYADYFSLSDFWQLSLDAVPSVPIQEGAALAERFSTTYLVLQALAVLLLTPAYLSGAIAIEKERRTLELLFTTHLLDREIVLGKMAARILHLVGVLLTGLPILSLAQMFGGVDFGVLVACFLSAVVTLCSMGGVCMLCSALSRSVAGALGLSYALVGLLCLGCVCPPFHALLSPLGFVWEVGRHQSAYSINAALGEFSGAMLGIGPTLGMVVPYAAWHGTIAMATTIWATAVLRQPEMRTRPATRGSTRAQPKSAPKPAALPIVPPAFESVVVGKHVPVFDDALRWKETQHGRYGSIGDVVSFLFGVLLMYALLVLVLAVIFRAAASSAEDGRISDGVQPFVRFCTCAAALCCCCVAGFRAAGCVARERDQRTLLGLLMLPISRNELLWAKWLGVILRQRRWVIYLAVILLIGLLTGGLHPVAVFGLAGLFAAQLAFAVSMGLCFSVFCRTALRANLLTAIVLFSEYLGIAVVMMFLPGSLSRGSWDVFVSGLHPLSSLWSLGFSWNDLAPRTWPGSGMLISELFGTGLIGIALYAGAACGLWVLACWRFRRESGSDG